MNNFNKLLSLQTFLFSFILLLTITACSDDDPPLPDNVASFESSALGMADDTDEVEIKISLIRAVDVATDVVVSFATSDLTYGDHFTTVPAASANSIVLTIPAQSSATSFNVFRSEGTFLEGDETISFTIDNIDEPALIGTSSTTVLSFSSIVSEGSQVTLNGLIATESGSSAGNAVYLDLSNNQQTAIARTSWDLGFYNGEDFRVIINNTSGASVLQVDKTDLASVTLSDINTDNLAVGFGAGTMDLIDSPDGDISKTAIDAISATVDENKSYVINRVGGSGTLGNVDDLIKVRIIRKGDNAYTLQYAKINETAITSVDVDKTATHNFEFFSFDNGKVSVEPAKDKWDLQWTWSIYQTENPPGSGSFLPYGFSDLVFSNHLNGTEVMEVLTSTIAYNDFDESDLTDGFVVSRNAIGSNWRVTSPTASAGVKTDRFYVVRDASRNVYKLKFVSFHPNDGGTRGKPVIEYSLVKKAE